MAHTGGSLFLQDNPQAAFRSFLPGLSRPVRRQFGRQFGDVYGEYLGALGQESRKTGQLPELQFTDFLQDFPFLQRFYGQSPQQRGFFPSSIVPKTRTLNLF